MRTREEDNQSTVRSGNTTIQVRGVRKHIATGNLEVFDQDLSVDGTLLDKNYRYFIDEPHRARTDAFGEANRWVEVVTPNAGSIVIHSPEFNTSDGFDNTGITYTNAGPWLQDNSHPAGPLFSNDLASEVIWGPWPFRSRGRMDINNAVQKQRARLWAYNGGLSETIAELPECPALFSLVSKSRSLRSNITGLSLGIKFGWAPLLQTFLQAYHELANWRQAAHSLVKRGGLRTVVYRGDDSWDFTKVFSRRYRTAPTTNYYGSSWVSELVSHEGAITYMARVNSRPYYDGAVMEFFQHLYHLGGIPSLRTAWELVPKSFIVDWFFSVGDLISSIQGNLLYDISVKEQAWSWKIHDRIDLRLETWAESPLICQQEINGFYRSSQAPAGAWQTPRVLPGLSSGQLSTLALLIAQKLPRGRWESNVGSLLKYLSWIGYR